MFFSLSYRLTDTLLYMWRLLGLIYSPCMHEETRPFQTQGLNIVRFINRGSVVDGIFTNM